MNDVESRPTEPTEQKQAAALSQQVAAKARRKLHARQQNIPGVWFGLGMMGLIGWAVVVPTLLGAALGFWLDQRFPSAHSWTLALLIGGLGIGCVNAWHWVAKEDAAMHAISQAAENLPMQADTQSAENLSQSLQKEESKHHD